MLAKLLKDRDALLIDKTDFIDELCDELKYDNPRFKPEKFKEAAGYYDQGII